jgi:acyl carrier protein phosphodiesterase
MLYDHFLANDPAIFSTPEALLTFTQTTYRQLQEHEAYFPPGFAAYFPHMRERNWLYNYRTLKGVERSLGGLQRRALYLPPVDKAYEIFISSYYQLNQCYLEFIDEQIRYVKSELAN